MNLPHRFLFCFLLLATRLATAADAPPVASNPFWDAQGREQAKEDRTSTIFLGQSPNKLACDTTLRLVPDGSWVHVMLGGGDKEPDPRNAIFLSRSHDEGKTWSAAERLDFGFPREGDTSALVPTELMVHGGRCTLFFATHDGAFGGWKEWFAVSGDSCATWGKPRPAPGRLHDRSFIRNHIVTRDGRILLPFQYYVGTPRYDPVNGVLISADDGKTWSEHGDIRLTKDAGYRGWAENNIVELADGRIAMIIRADRLGGVLYYAESNDGGVTWPEFAAKTNIPNPGSKATLYGLGGNRVALLHNPDPKVRSPLALWISFDGMKTWPYQRVLRGDLEGRFNYPDGFVSADRKWLHFAFDHNRDKAIHVSARLPEPQVLTEALWFSDQPVPKAAELSELKGVRFHVVKASEPKIDDYKWLHGVALAWHKGRLFASFGHNKGAENTTGEEARGRVSSDGGQTWGEVFTIATPDEPNLGISHGVFVSRGGELWACHGAFYGNRLTDIANSKVHTRAYRLNETTGKWESQGSVIEGGFWPMQEPLKMADGNWIMSGLRVGGGHPGAVAISHGDDLTRWDLVPIPRPDTVRMWGESTIILDGKRVQNFARINHQPPRSVLTAVSNDYGRTWTDFASSNLPMVGSKPYTGRLSNGQPYLVCTTTAEAEESNRRSPLTIAVGKPGDRGFRKIFRIRDAVWPASPGRSHPAASMSYPYAVEHDGHLYVGFTNGGAELAVIPIEALQVE